MHVCLCFLTLDFGEASFFSSLEPMTHTLCVCVCVCVRACVCEEMQGKLVEKHIINTNKLVLASPCCIVHHLCSKCDASLCDSLCHSSHVSMFWCVLSSQLMASLGVFWCLLLSSFHLTEFWVCLCLSFPEIKDETITHKIKPSLIR